MPTSNLICLNGQQDVINCGLGVSRGLFDQGMQLKDLSLIFISHLHSDHYLELGALIHTAWTAGLDTPVDFYGPDGLMAHWLRSHSFAHDAAKKAQNSGVKRLALSHLISSDDPTYGPKDWQDACADHYHGELIVGHDGLRINL